MDRPTSLDVFSRIIDRLPGLRALLLITFRPGVRRAVDRPRPCRVAFAQPLRAASGRGDDRWSDRRQGATDGGSGEIVAKTDGVPLFVEELTKTVLESGLVREENGSYVLAAALTPLAIPSTLQELADGAA